MVDEDRHEMLQFLQFVTKSIGGTVQRLEFAGRALDVAQLEVHQIKKSVDI
jgi:hypothetical protein